jgi:hypothetical protein
VKDAAPLEVSAGSDSEGSLDDGRGVGTEGRF